MAVDLARERHERAVRRAKEALSDLKAALVQGIDRVIDAMDDLAIGAASSPQDPASAGKLLTIGAAATRLGVSRNVLSGLARRGDIPTVPIASVRGSRPMRRFREADIDNYRGRVAS